MKYLYVSHRGTPVDYRGEKKKKTLQRTDIITMMKEKLPSPSIHCLIGLVARSGWPFVCATRALFLLSLSLSFFFTTPMVDSNSEVIRVD
jgi:hypothetical protein